MSVAPPPDPKPPEPGLRGPAWPLWLAVGFAALLAILVLVVAALYLSRRSLGRELAVDWLRDRGVEALIDVERLDLDGFTGRLRIGPAEDPEVVVDRVEVRYQVMGFWNGRPLGVEVAEVRLIRPVARGEWRGGTLRMGQLDKVIEEFRRRPPRPDARQPIVRIEQGRFVLATDYGRADLRGDARLEDGKLISLDAGLQPTALKVGQLSAAIGEARVTARTRGDRVAVAGRFGLQTLTLGETQGEMVRLDLTGEIPYPDLKARRGDGRVTLSARAAADRFATPGLTARTASADLAFDGQARGWVDTLAVSGLARTRVTAGAARTADLSLADLVVEGQGPAGFDAKAGPRLRLAASVRGQGGWGGLGPVRRTDDATMRAVKRLAARFDLSAPGVSVAIDRSLAVGLTRPARIAGAGGAVAIVSPQPGAPLLADGAGALRLVLRGGGLPTVDAVVPRYVLTGDGARAEISGTAAGSLGPLMGATLRTRGRLTLGKGAISYVAAACTPVTLERLELGVNDVERLAGSLCPTAAPLLTLNDGAWRVRARAQGLSALAPFLEARVTDGAGVMDLGGRNEAFQADMTIASARVADTAAVTRFHPVVVSGTVASRGGDWTGNLAAVDPGGRPLGRATLSHQGLAGRGGLVFDTGVLTFAEGGLQPSALTPLASAIGEPATGRARFEGHVDWTEATVNGGGTLTLEDVGFRSVLGPMTGLDGRLVFTSLIPLVTAPGQTVTVARVAAIAPLTDIKASFELDGPVLKLAGASLQVGGGAMRLDPTEVRLDGAAWEGRLNVDGVQLSELVEASPFADRVDLDAKVSGVLPFTVTPQRVTVAEGKLAAIQPGRISIRREALAVVSAEGGEATVPEAPAVPGVPAPPSTTSTVSEFAYQAMEHLAFDHLDVTLNSLPAGRLGALFHVNGRFDPPQRQELRLSLVDLITRRFLQRSLPLPSGTAVNLTLDSSLNIDELLRDVAAANSPSSPAVQP